MCDHAGVGSLVDNKPEGTEEDQEGIPLPCEDGPGLFIPTLEGLMLARPLDYVIRGVQGELYACKEDIFNMTYELVDDQAKF